MSNVNLKVVIPAGIKFTDLELSREPDGKLSFNDDVIEYVRTYSNVPSHATCSASDDDLLLFIVSWYLHHCANGGVKDPVAEHLMSQIDQYDQADLTQGSTEIPPSMVH